MLGTTLAGLFKTIVLLGVVQGMIVGTLLFSTRKSKPANRYLAVLIFLISLACLSQYCVYENWFGNEWLRALSNYIPLIIVMPFGPLIFFYVQTYSGTPTVIKRKRRLHFYPVIVDLVPALTTVIFTVGVLTNTIRNNQAPWGNFIDTYNVYADIPRWLSISIYLYASMRWIVRHRGSLRQSPKDARWLRQFMWGFALFQLIWLVYLVPYVIPAYTDKMIGTFNWYPIFIPLTILIYWLGLKGYIMSYGQGNARKKSPAIFPPESAGAIIDRLNKAMEEDKLYLNPGLDLNILARELSLPPKLISSVLNQYLSKSFNVFVNEYRVSACKERIGRAGLGHLTLAGIAAECGFNSQSTFQRTFKEMTGLSPSAFRKAVEEA